TYEPLYRDCYQSFPLDPDAAMCHWRVAWDHYLHRGADAGNLLREHLRRFPGSADAPAALYFLGRLAQGSDEDGAARAYYDEIVHRYPNYYFAILARERLKEVHAPPSPETTAFLHEIAFPPRARALDFVPDAISKIRIERARLLVEAGLDDWAEGELRFGAQTGAQPQVLAIRLAELASRREGPAQAMSYIKHYASGYLYLPIDSAPAEFWKLAFPMPYRADLDRFARRNGLDPFLLAALIRQESEFNPKVISPANARGLTQIVPSTGRELSRRLKIRHYSTARLFQPAVNLELGSYYLKSIADSVGGRWEVALAAYNAGASRAHAWLGWGDFREPAEFIETVPFSQTRNYIQTVLRNAEMYRKLYGGVETEKASFRLPTAAPKSASLK
ncbi:MAG: transglycosylase SLT domain-containing protein, partial [Bryobacteraceae bacterium]